METIKVSTALDILQNLYNQGVARDKNFESLYLVWSLLSELGIQASFEADNDEYTVRLT